MTYVADLSDISFDAEGEDGDLVRRQIARRAWTDGGWATVMIVFEERSRDRESWRAPKLMVLRMRRVGDGWKKQSSVTLPATHAAGLRGELELVADRLVASDD
ncbi:MAG: hypothetical protein H0T42_05685 [Deltaproteobacteria bacterium]|nr:hypothetical protein [Deltaproteobacteria bacterium]